MAPFSPPESADYAFLAPEDNSSTIQRWEAEFAPSDFPGPRLTAGAEAAAAIRWIARHRPADATPGWIEVRAVTSSAHLALGIWIAPPFRQQGHATALGRILLEWAWEHGARRVETVHVSTAPGAAELAERLGFLPEGVQRGVPLPGCESPVDLVHWGVLARDR